MCVPSFPPCITIIIQDGDHGFVGKHNESILVFWQRGQREVEHFIFFKSVSKTEGGERKRGGEGKRRGERGRGREREGMKEREREERELEIKR